MDENSRNCAILLLYDNAERSSSRETGPGRRISSFSEVQSTTVEATPPGVRPPLRMSGMSPSSWERTSCAVLALGLPDRLAEVTASGPVCRIRVSAAGWSRHPHAHRGQRRQDFRQVPAAGDDQGQRARPEARCQPLNDWADFGGDLRQQDGSPIRTGIALARPDL